MTSGLDRALVERLLATSRGGRWDVGVDRFRDVLDDSLSHAFGSQTPSRSEVEAYLTSLHLEDLALATACADGHEAAWDHFVREVRPIVYRAADALDPSGSSRDLADGLYGELFGVTETDGRRRSLFRYFHGRSSLSTWVRAVLSQRFIDRQRSRRRLDDLPDEESAHALSVAAEPPDPERRSRVLLVHHVLQAAIAALVPRDRLALGCYYAQNLKMAAIGRLIGESEATVSRRLARVRREIGEAVEKSLRRDHLWSSAQIAEVASRKNDDPARSMDRGGRRVERA